MKPNKHERVLAWRHRGLSFWGGMAGEEIHQDAPLTGPDVDDWLFGDDVKFEVWYLSALDEVWVYCDYELGGNYRSQVATKHKHKHKRNRNAAYSLRKTAGEPLARWPCPETPEELRALCRMFIELYGGHHDR